MCAHKHWRKVVHNEIQATFRGHKKQPRLQHVEAIPAWILGKCQIFPKWNDGAKVLHRFSWSNTSSAKSHPSKPTIVWLRARPLRQWKWNMGTNIIDHSLQSIDLINFFSLKKKRSHNFMTKSYAWESRMSPPLLTSKISVQSCCCPVFCQIKWFFHEWIKNGQNNTAPGGEQSVSGGAKVWNPRATLKFALF